MAVAEFCSLYLRSKGPFFDQDRWVINEGNRLRIYADASATVGTSDGEKWCAGGEHEIEVLCTSASSLGEI